MIVFDLICADGDHLFEGWFGSSMDYEEQQQRGLLDCPVCGCSKIVKAAMAPSVGRKGNQQPTAAKPTDLVREAQAPVPTSNTVATTPEYKELIGKLAKVQNELLADSEWVGDKFADRARDIHYGEAEEKPIHGIASHEDVCDLAEEGIVAIPLALPVVPPESKN